MINWSRFIGCDLYNAELDLIVLIVVFAGNASSRCRSNRLIPAYVADVMKLNDQSQ